MRILFLTHYFPPEGNAPASRTFDNCRRWVAAGHEVTVITCAPNVPSGVVYEGYRNRWRQEERIEGIRVIRVWTFIAPNKGAFRRILNYLSYFVSSFFTTILLKKPDVLVCTSPQFFCGLSGVMAGVLKRIPTVLEIRDIWPESIEAVGAMKKSFLTRMLERVERWMYRKSDQIVTVGSGYKQKLLERGVPEEKIEVITNGADLKFYQPGKSDPEILEDLGVNEASLNLAYVGTLGMASGLEVVIEAGKILAEAGDAVCFYLVGDGARRDEYLKMVEEAGLKNVKLPGRMEKAKMPGLLRSMDVAVIHLKKSDLFKTVLPSKLFEAFACGLPVILGVDGNAREVLEQADAGVFMEPGNADELVGAIRKFNQDPEGLCQYGEKGLAHVRAYYDRDKLAEVYLSLLIQMCK
ncbi:glycosyltransferase family 4 protein [Kiritimatiellaeota bacterium B1221]|nr:glycosyltransferase family 4 protein [Kiritimatiellaeota bacterium B1221]